MFSAYQSILNVAIDSIIEKKRILLNQAHLRSPPIKVNTVKASATNRRFSVTKVLGNGISPAELIPSCDKCD
jgi:hypothetical protein